VNEENDLRASLQFPNIAVMKALLCFATLALLASPASAQEVKALGSFGKWLAFTYTENGKPVCYVSAKPEKSEGAYKSRGDVLFLVTHRPAEKAFDVVSMVAGYQYKPDSDAEISSGGKTFKLFTNADRAWARDSQTDQQVVQALIKGSTAVVKGVSSRNTPTTDTFSLNGFTAAYKAISETCKKPG
jgi:invasion protein IalB